MRKEKGRVLMGCWPLLLLGPWGWLTGLALPAAHAPSGPAGTVDRCLSVLPSWPTYVPVCVLQRGGGVPALAGDRREASLPLPADVGMPGDE